MTVILTHEKADFDAVASQLAARRLFPDAIALLPRQLNRNVQQFLNLYWDTLLYMRAEEWRRRPTGEVILVDTQSFGSVPGLVDNPDVLAIDHHILLKRNPGWRYEVEQVGATTTLLLERIQVAGLVLTPEEATLLLLGIYEDTGSLTYDTTTARDVRAAAWLMEQGAMLDVARRFLAIAFTDAQQALYDCLLRAITWERIEGQSIAIASCAAPKGFDDEISSVAHRLRETLTPDGLFVLVQLGDGVQLVARSSSDNVDAGAVARRLGGGGHSRAAAAMIGGETLASAAKRLQEILPDAVTPMQRVASVMSHGVETLPVTTTVAEAAERMQRLGHEGYPVVDKRRRQVVGLLERRAVDRAMGHDLGHLPIGRIMRSGDVWVRPSDPISRVQELMAAEGWGQIPVLPEPGAEPAGAEDGLPIGIVTRTDLLNLMFRPAPDTRDGDVRDLLAAVLSPELWSFVRLLSDTAARLNMPVYFVGGFVRDILLGKTPTDLDIVVEGDAIALVEDLRRRFGGDVHSHDRFGTAKWEVGPEVWSNLRQAAAGQQGAAPERTIDADPAAQLSPPPQIDFVTARKEFYKRPTALPDVERGSIKLDLHRRDFTINTLAIRLDGAHLGQLQDFYGGRRDLRRGLIRVLHSLSFIDDPTRILRAVRLEQRLDFAIEQGTAELIASALPMLARITGDRIRNEIEMALGEANPVQVLERLDELGVLEHITPGLGWTTEAASAFERVAQFAGDPLWKAIYQSGPEVFYYFALWLSPYDRDLQAAVARRLRVRKATMEDLLALSDLREVLQAFDVTTQPSVVTRQLRQFSPRVLLSARILAGDSVTGALLDRYIAEWRHVKPATSGDDLRRLGLPPGPAYTRILDRLLAARLDGELFDDAEETAMRDELLAEMGHSPGRA